MIPSYAWLEQAACRGMDTSTFFPERGDTKKCEIAKAICADCPAVYRCGYASVMEGDFHGIRGGMSERQRRRVRTDRARLAFLRVRAELEAAS